MVFGRYARRGRRRWSSLHPINSIKNIRQESIGITSTQQNLILIRAKEQPVITNVADVQSGCTINSIFLEFDVCGLGGTGVLNDAFIMLFKNPGNNLTVPAIDTAGSSDEKRFILKMWKIMIMRNQDGNAPVHWSGWIPLPKTFKRFGINDELQLCVKSTTALTGHFQYQCIYKWLR